MNREIKFRVWDGERVFFPDMFCPAGRVGGWSSYDGTRPKEAVVMQYTGMKDADGTEIYEGDVVEVSQGNVYARGVMEWKKGDACFALSSGPRYPLGPRKYRVIGNVYENPELVET